MDTALRFEGNQGLSRAGTLKTVAVIIACVTPSAAVNIWPQIAPMANGSAAVDGNAIIWASVQATFVLVMAWCSTAYERVSWRTAPDKKILALVFGLFLFGLNFFSAIDMAAHRQDDKATTNRGAMVDVATIQSQLTAAQRARNALPAFAPASAGAVTAAKKAAEDATKSRLDECKKRGDNCRLREADERTANAALADVESRKALTDEARRLDTKIDTLTAEQSARGAAPKSEDGGAQRVGAVLAMLGVPLGSDPAAKVAEVRPVAVALGVELIALLGPVIFMMAFPSASVPAPAAPHRDWKLPTLRIRRRAEPIAIVSAAPAPVVEAPALALAAAPAQVDGGLPATFAGVCIEAETPATPAAVQLPQNPLEQTPAIAGVCGGFAGVLREFAGVAKPRLSNEKSRSPRQVQTAGEGAGVGSVREWFNTQTTARQGHKTPAGQVYAAYNRWCAATRKTPVNQTVFGKTMRDEIEAEKETVNKRTSYCGFTINSTLALVAAE